MADVEPIPAAPGEAVEQVDHGITLVAIGIIARGQVDTITHLLSQRRAPKELLARAPLSHSCVGVRRQANRQNERAEYDSEDSCYWHV